MALRKEDRRSVFDMLLLATNLRRDLYYVYPSDVARYEYESIVHFFVKLSVKAYVIPKALSVGNIVVGDRSN
jgi:hypothetical protein